MVCGDKLIERQRIENRITLNAFYNVSLPNNVIPLTTEEGNKKTKGLVNFVVSLRIGAPL